MASAKGVPKTDAVFFLEYRFFRCRIVMLTCSLARYGHIICLEGLGIFVKVDILSILRHLLHRRCLAKMDSGIG